MMEEDEPRIGGHDFVFVDELSTGQTCSICLLAMRSPVQTVCGHRFCKSCLLETFREGHDQVCPQDRTPIPDGGFFQDVAWDRDILSLRVKCKRSDRGCNWTGQLRHYEEHFNLCEYEDVTCGDCYNEMQRRLLHKHTTSECHHRVVQCEYCEEEFEFRQKKYHKDNLCTRFPLDCPQECGVQEIPREEVESHMRDDCAMTMVLCPYEEAGCTFHDKRSHLNDHLEASSEEHLRKTWFTLLNELKAVEGQIEELQTDKESMKMLLDCKSEEISDLKMTTKELEVENMALKKDAAALQKQLEEVKLTAADDKKEVSSLKSEYKALKKDTAALQKQLEEVKLTATDDKKEVSSLKSEYIALKKDAAALQKQLEEVKLTAADYKKEVTSLKSEHKALKKEEEELRCSRSSVRHVPEKLEKMSGLKQETYMGLSGVVSQNELPQAVWSTTRIVTDYCDVVECQNSRLETEVARADAGEAKKKKPTTVQVTPPQPVLQCRSKQ